MFLLGIHNVTMDNYSYCVLPPMHILFDDRIIEKVNLVLDQNGGDIPHLHLHLLPPAADGLVGLPVCGGEHQHACLST